MASPDLLNAVPLLLRERAVRIFTYLKELTQLRSEVVRDLSSYEDVLWFHEVPHEPGCTTIAWGAPDEEEAWLEVQKQTEPRLPSVPEACEPWVDASRLRRDDLAPQLRERILAPILAALPNIPIEEDREPEFLSIEDYPEVQALWSKFIEERWAPWSEAHRSWAKVQLVYGRLFTMHQQQKRLGEAYELVLGVGVLNWRTPSGQVVRRHLLVGQTDLSFNANKGTLTVRAGSSGVKLTLETDMLEPGERPAIGQQLVAEDVLQHAAESPWEKLLIEPVIRTWVNSLGPAAVYEDLLENLSSTSQCPRARFAPALILRKRTSRNLLRLLNDIIGNITNGGPIPTGILRLCDIGEARPGGDGDAQGGRLATDNEVYFPLPANEEQRRIVERLRTSDGVVVQGPPGTGKSHTIANLICHLLANGQRVLIASQTPRALKVLKDKIPPQISALAVSLLGNDQAALQDLEDSVLGITEQHYSWDLKRNQQISAEIGSDIADCRGKIATVDRQLRELREKESYEQQIAGGDYSGTALRISKQVVADAPLHEWFPDHIREKAALPFEKGKFFLLLHAYRELTPARQAELEHVCVPRSVLPDAEAFLEMIRRENSAEAHCAQFPAQPDSLDFRVIRSASLQQRENLRRALSQLLNATGELRRIPFPWVPEATTHLLAGRLRTWFELRDTLAPHLEGLMERARAAQIRTIICPPEHLAERDRLRQDAFELWTHLNAGNGLGWGPFRAVVVKQTLFLTQTVRVNGRACSMPDTLAELIEHLDFQTLLDHAWHAWTGVIERVDMPYGRQAAFLEEQLQALEFLLAAHPSLEAAQSATAAAGLSQANFHEEALNGLISNIDAAEAALALRTAESAFNGIIEKIQKVALLANAHPLNGRAIALLEDRMIEGWDKLLEEVHELERDAVLLSERKRLVILLESEAPELSSLLARTAEDPAWDTRLHGIEKTWAWARANGWIRDWDREHDAATLEPERAALSQRLQQKIADLAAQKAWRHLFEDRLEEKHRQHLMAWTQAVKRIGKGTGKRAEKHRSDAQEHMNACRDAIPAWIMPFYRIAESLSASPQAFDVVIVDEASQSGPETLLLLYLAKKCIIVGDDQQISPEAVGVKREDVDLLIERHLWDIPHASSFGVETSLFNQAIIRFGGRIVLREHFRCMPEIIRFSNDLCYLATPLLPLRQYPPQRLEPIVTRHVADGYREGGSQAARNSPEAEALVDAICQCCRDERYDGKTFGVISLQGEYQSRVIERMLLNRLEPEEIEARELVCGDAYAFQGDERDVIFLSLVAAPNERIGALVKDTDKRRFNVAASRARDQLWLFHTATLNDLNSGDMRYKLLSYCLNPQKSIVGEPDWGVCESEFEREVGRRIYARNYRLLLQFEPFGRGGKRIDMVVEGLKGRLAVECDGDHWHGPERYDEDMARQRQLERCGWTFWRVRGSTFYQDPQKALEPLWLHLAGLEILPFDATFAPENACLPEAEAKAPAPSVVSYSHSGRNDEVEKTDLEWDQLTPTEIGPSPPPTIPEPSSTDPTPNLVATDAEENHQSAKPSRAVTALVAIEDFPEAQVRETLIAAVPAKGQIEREELLMAAAITLGSKHLTRKLRSRLNKALSALDQAGRIKTDWTNVWLPGSETPAQLGLFEN